MDVLDYRNNKTISSQKIKLFQEADRWKTVGLKLAEPDHKLVNVLLTGGAPWGFSLKGGIEHRQPLIITKVEEGRQAAVSLQVGDELVNINMLPLSGSRQEAVCLVKSSYQSLALLVRRKPLKMVDIVSQTMPSDSDVHGARNFLTKILRSSMRKNEPASRPHSWHSPQVTEGETGSTESQPPAAPDSWQSQYEARNSSREQLSICGDQPDLHATPSGFSSASSSMEKLERPSPSLPYIQGRHSPTKYPAEPHCGGVPAVKRESSFSCFSVSTSPPPPDPCPGDDTTAETLFYKGPQGEGQRQSERPRHLLLPSGSGGWEGPRSSDDQPGTRVSHAGRFHVGPVWHVPERKETTAPSPPPPPPPMRSDSFAVTKVFPFSETSAAPKFQGRVAERSSDTNSHGNLHGNHQHPLPHHLPLAHHHHHHHHNNHHTYSHQGPEARRSYIPSPLKKDHLHPPPAAEHSQFHPNKLHSLSSNDVRHGTSLASHPPNHQRQRSEESPFYLQTRANPDRQCVKPQSVASYYRSLQDLPANAPSKPGRSSMASLSGSSVDHILENGGHIRYYCITTQQPAQVQPPAARQGNADSRWGEKDTTHWGKNYNGGTLSSAQVNNHKVKHPPGQSPLDEKKERNGRVRPPNGNTYDPAALGLLSLGKAGSMEERDCPRRMEGLFSDIQRFANSRHAAELKPSRERLQDPWVPQQDHRISAQRTPLLHSLTQERRLLAGKKLPATPSSSSLSLSSNPTAVGVDTALCQEPTSDNHTAAAGGKIVRRSDRYATTLRHEIQQKRAQLQKSRSAAALSCPAEEGEDQSGRSSTAASSDAASATSSSDRSFSHSYKDHLKEAQARVLQATSFQRRDLEPVGAEPTTGKSAGYHQGALSRIGGRKRFSADKRSRSYSEPDKIHKVGVEGEHFSGSLGERRRFFEAKQDFTRVVSQHGHQNLGEDRGEAGEARQRVRSGEHRPGTELAPDSPSSRQAWMEKQRLGTFAEYQATWNMQRKVSDGKTPGKGKYHSAENILDAEENSLCVHERSRSSPSADFYGPRNILWMDSVENPYLEQRNYQPPSKEQSELRVREDHPSPLVRGHTDQCVPDPRAYILGRDSSPSLPSDLRPKPEPGSHHSYTLSPSTPNHSHSQGSWTPGSKPQPAQTQELPPPRLKTTSSSQECLAGVQPEAAAAAAAAAVVGAAAAAAAAGAHPHQTSISNSSHRGTQRDPAPTGSSSLGSSLAESPCPGNPPGASRLDEGRTREEDGVPSLTATEPPPSSSPPSSRTTTAAGSIPPADGPRSPPSPSRRPSDRSPEAMQDSTQGRPENVPEARMDVNGSVQTAPVRIIITESLLQSSEKYQQHHQYQQQQGGALAPGASINSSPTQPHTTGPPGQANPWSGAQAQAEDGVLPVQGPPAPRPSDGGGPAEVEDQKREELVRDIMDKDKSLVEILDQSRMRTTMDLMEGLFPQGQKLLEGSHPRRKGGSKQSGSPRGVEDRREEEGVCASASLVPSSSYYSTSAPKAELLIKMKDLQDQMENEEDEEDEELDVNLASKKRELISSLSQKLEVLREARESLQEDVEDNEALGQEVEASVQQLCQPNQLDKFRMFVGDLDKVVSLLLSLSGRLARVENALNSLEEDASPEEKRTLTQKRKLLIRQHEDAKELKENLDRRERLVYDIMAANLGSERLADYRHFVKMKSALIIEQRKLDDKMKLGEEQLRGLMESVPDGQPGVAN